MAREFDLLSEGGLFTVTTRGLRTSHGRELRAAVQEQSAIPDAKELITQAADQLHGFDKRPERWTSSAGFRALVWVADDEWYTGFEVDDTRKLPTIQQAASDWGAQHWVCERYGASFDPFTDDSLVSIAPAILDPNVAVEGTRYEMSGAMAGWFLIDEHFVGSVHDLQIEHARHVAEARPDLVRYFGLPPGWRFFRTATGESVEQLSELMPST